MNTGDKVSPGRTSDARAELIGMARRNMLHAEAGTIEQADGVVRVPASNYFDERQWQREVDQVFKRVPLMLAMSCELKAAGDFKTLEVCGVPVLLVRDDEQVVRAFINSCSHRGAVVVTEQRGSRTRFSCPYHAWTYDGRGDLVSIYAESDFGEIDKSCHGLTRLPAGERAGMVWVSLDPESTLDLDVFLCGYDQLLAQFDFADWSLFEDRTVKGPNWKIAYDGYLDLYHLPILHRNTFGANIPNQALYDAWGPHQRVSSSDPGLLKLKDSNESDWPTARLLQGVWTIFPHVSIASFDGGGAFRVDEVVMIPVHVRSARKLAARRLANIERDEANTGFDQLSSQQITLPSMAHAISLADTRPLTLQIEGFPSCRIGQHIDRLCA